MDRIPIEGEDFEKRIERIEKVLPKKMSNLFKRKGKKRLNEFVPVC
jgi:hypothetical protein